MYRNALPRVLSSPSNWKDAAVSVAPESYSELDTVYLNTGLDPTHDSDPVAINCWVDLLVVLRGRIYDWNLGRFLCCAWHFVLIPCSL